MTREELEAFAQQLAPSGADYSLWHKLARDALVYQRALAPQSVLPRTSPAAPAVEQPVRDRAIRRHLN